VNAAPRVPRVLACSSALLLLSLASCGIPTNGSTHPIANDNVPFDLLAPAPTTSTTTSVVGAASTTTIQPEIVYLYFVRNDRIQLVSRPLTESLGVPPRLQLLSGPLTAAEMEQGFRSAVPQGAVTDVAVAGGVATVDLSPTFIEVPPKEQVLAFAQITYTLTQLPGIGQVSFPLNKAPIQALDDKGVVVNGSVTKETYLGILAS
jgi:spore germination protein GerM